MLAPCDGACASAPTWRSCAHSRCQSRLSAIDGALGQKGPPRVAPLCRGRSGTYTPRGRRARARGS